MSPGRQITKGRCNDGPFYYSLRSIDRLAEEKCGPVQKLSRRRLLALPQVISEHADIMHGPHFSSTYIFPPADWNNFESD